MLSDALQALVGRGGKELGGQQVRAEIEVFDLFAANFEGKVLDKPQITAAIMANQYPIANEIQHFRDDRLDRRRVFEHLIIDARHLVHERLNREMWIDQRVVAISDPAVLIAERTDLDNAVLLRTAARGFEIEDYVASCSECLVYLDTATGRVAIASAAVSASALLASTAGRSGHA